MKKYSLLLLLFCCTFLINACSDEDDGPSKEEMLVNKRWQITALTVSSPFFSGTMDLYADFEDCERDNYLEFKSGGILTIYEGQTKCDPSFPNQIEGTWSIEGDILHLEGLGASYDIPVNELNLTINELTNTRISAKFDETMYSGTVEMEVM